MNLKLVSMLTKGGNPAADQYTVYDDNGCAFVSYGKEIVRRNSAGETLLDERYWNYSNTTGKYRNKFLGESIAKTRKKLLSGEYTLTNLN